MRRHWHRYVPFLVLALTIAGLLGSSLSSRAAETLDQSQPEYVLGTGRAVRVSLQIAQTFEAGISGDLTRVDVALWYNEKYTPITVEIRQSDPAGTLLASTEIPASSVTAHFAGGVDPGWVTATFSTPAAVEAGTTYAIVLKTTANSVYSWAIAGYDAYLNGTAWLCSGLPTCSWTAISDNDMAFKTYVDVAIEYSIVPLYDVQHDTKAGKTVPVKIQVNDASEANVSAADLVLHAVSLTKDATPITPVPAPGASQPDSAFVFDPSLGEGGGYQFNVKTTDLEPGVWTLNFTIGDDSTIYTTAFELR